MRNFQENPAGYGLGALPFPPLALWQAGLHMMNQWQQAWLKLLVAPSAPWPGTQAMMATMLPFMPRIEASVTPLPTEGSLAGASEAARVSLRLTLPGVPGLAGPQGGGEVVLVDAVVARAADSGALRLDSIEAPAALPEKSR